MELKKLITLKYLKEEAKKEKITKFSTMNKSKLFAALEDNLNDKKEWFSYLNSIYKHQVETKPTATRKKKTTTPKKTPTTKKKPTTPKNPPTTNKKPTTTKKTEEPQDDDKDQPISDLLQKKSPKAPSKSPKTQPRSLKTI